MPFKATRASSTTAYGVLKSNAILTGRAVIRIDVIMDNTVRSCLLILTFIAGTTSLYFMRDLITPFALALFIWLTIDGLARWLYGLSAKFPYWLALTVAVFTVLASLTGVVLIITGTGIDIVEQSPRYAKRLEVIFQWLDGKVSKIAANVFKKQDFHLAAISDQINLEERIPQFLSDIVGSLKSFGSNFMLIAIYVAFLFAAQSSFPKKMDDLFPDINKRAQAAKVGERIRHSIEKYLGVQTIISLLQTFVSYVAMTALGLDNALFWALLIFILNYIPIVGGLAAIVLPVTFAIVQFESVTPIVILAGALFGAQFVIGNTIQPKMMGDSMNLSALVVVLSLTLWGALWGGVGMFLSAPLTVVIMIILAQFPTTRWIAVLLSADGEPDMDEMEKKAKKAMPSM